MQRRTFIGFIAAAGAWPLIAHAQQREQMRRIAVVTGLAGNDPETKVRTAAFLQELQRLGWIEGSNIRVDVRGVVGAMLLGRSKKRRWPRSTWKCDNEPRSGFVVRTSVIFRWQSNK